MAVPFLNLDHQNGAVRQEIEDAVRSVLDSQQFILGDFVKKFEAEFASFCGVQHAIAVNSGTSALHLALLAAGVGPGDEVITTPLTFVATAAAIRYCGATPVYVDIDPYTFNLNASLVEPALTTRTKALLPVHLFGQPCEMDHLRSFALPVIEDAAQAHGAEYHGTRVGGLGAMGCFSFYPTKNLGACGEAGMVTTDDPDLAAKVALLRDWGAKTKYVHTTLGFNYRMEGMQAAILSAKLKHLNRWTEQRRESAHFYDERIPHPVFVSPGVRHVYHTYTVRSPQRDLLKQRLEEQGIGTAIHYPLPVHRQAAFFDPVVLPEAEKASREVLSLPMYPGLSRESQSEVVRVLIEHD